MSYGRHQSFYLKNHWINKGIKALIMSPEGDVFIDKDGFKELGIGKNMQQALRYWLEAVNVITLSDDKKRHELTFFGELINKYDPSCILYFTKLLIHFYLVSSLENGNDPFSHSFYWFFRVNKDSYISKDKIKEGLNIYSKHLVSPNTLNRDTDCLIQTYTNKEKKHPEDKNVALLADLNLLLKDKQVLVKSPVRKDFQGSYAFYFSLVTLKEEIELSVNSITESIGSIFNLNRTEVIETIEFLSNLGVPITITRTNNLDTVKIDEKVFHKDLLQNIYEKVTINEK